MATKYDYDAIVIGAGIGGLVCGCYLVKGGLRTLIVEKNAKPGGYCTSFSRNGFKFDACAHSLGSFRKDGILKTIFEELELEKRIVISRDNPQDIIIGPNEKIYFFNDLAETLSKFQENFPREARNLKRFFDFLSECNGIAFNSIKNITFGDLLDKYFEDQKLKAILSLPVLGNAGLSPSRASAFTAVALYKEFMIDGGYYPKKGMQQLPDTMLASFREQGGVAFLPSFVSKIKVKENCVEGVEINGRDYISAKYIVSDTDASQTFLELIGERIICRDIRDKLKVLKPSLSILILYLGTDGHLGDLPINTNIWFMPDYDINKMYQLASDGKVEELDWFLIRLMPDKKSIIMLVNAPFKNIEYWTSNKEKLIEVFIKKISRIIPDISKHIVIKDAATPATLYRWTLNHLGSAYGWEGIPSQFAIDEFSQITPVKNLYLTGHWTTLTQGISGVARLGRDTAKIILNKEKVKR